MHDPGGSSEPSDLGTFETKQLATKTEERDLDTSESQDGGVKCSLANNYIPVLGLWYYCLAPDKINMFEMSHGARATRDPSKKQDDKQPINSATEKEYFPRTEFKGNKGQLIKPDSQVVPKTSTV